MRLEHEATSPHGVDKTFGSLNKTAGIIGVKNLGGLSEGLMREFLVNEAEFFGL
jgi:hypothetical protein